MIEADPMLTVETVETLIASSRPRSGIFRGPNLVLLGLSMLLGASLANSNLFTDGGLWSWLFPQILLIVLFALMIRSTYQQRRMGQLMLGAFEAVQLRENQQARELLGRLLRHPIQPPPARAESLLALAAVAEADHAYDVSQHIYESLMAENIADPIQLHTTRVALAAAMLRTGQTTDAVQLIDRLERADVPEPLRAQVELLTLFRAVTMGQTQPELARAQERRRLFRLYLSTRAGYGYGLLAVMFDRADQPELARRTWRDATLLVDPKELLSRFAELKPVAAKYPAAEMKL